MAVADWDTFDASGTTGVGKNLREDLWNQIYRLTPAETPVLNSIGRVDATAIFHEWNTDTLAAFTTNAAIEGDDASFAAAATTRVGNRCQILTKGLNLSDTLNAVSTATGERELARQKVKKGLEIKRDLEFHLIGVNQASLPGASGTTARKIGSLSSWLTSNDNGTPGASPANRGTGGAAGGFSGSNTVAATDGTTRAFDQPMLDGVIAKRWENAGMVDGMNIHAGAKQKNVLTNFDGIAGSVRHEASDMRIIATADIYVSQFGDLKIVPNRYIRKTSSVDREIYGLDPEYLKIAVLRPMTTKELGATGDASKWMLRTEVTLQVSNEAAHFVVADLS